MTTENTVREILTNALGRIHAHIAISTDDRDAAVARLAEAEESIANLTAQAAEVQAALDADV